MATPQPQSSQQPWWKQLWKAIRRFTIGSLSPGALLAISLVEFGILVVLLLARAYRWLGVDSLPNPVGGVVPLVVPWAGALGGVCICLVGIAAHYSSWGNGERWNVWYLVRPALGAAFGTFAALFVVLLLGTVGVTSGGPPDLSAFGSATLMAIAFVVGYREQTFRALVGRVVDVIIGPGAETSDDEQAVPGGFTLDTAELDFGEVPVNGSQTQSVRVTNRGRRPLGVHRSTVELAGDSAFHLGEAPGNIPSGESRKLDIQFTPTLNGEAASTLTISVGGEVKTVALKGMGG
jgi:Abnormal spindle-like microcephaly-assoc'd, ASPM-SPD-2-Hydin